MNRLKTLENKKIKITTTSGEVTKYKGYLIGDIPNEYTAWFNYKGLTYVIY